MTQTPVGNSPAGNSNSSSIASNTVEGIERMTKSAHSGIDTASKAAHPAIDRLASGAHKAVDSADDLVGNAEKALEKAGVKGEELLAVGNRYMNEHPLLTLGVAVTAGYVLSRIIAAR